VRAAAAVAATGGAPSDDCPLLLLDDAARDLGAVVGDSLARPPDNDRSSALAATALVAVQRWAMTVSATPWIDVRAHSRSSLADLAITL
jgi:hypothetical protein